jgi:predicted amidohydrolase YtcJ
MAYFIEPSMLDNEETLLENLTAWRTWGAALSDEHLIAGESVKLYIDGVPGNHTAFLSEPYTTRPTNTANPNGAGGIRPGRRPGRRPGSADSHAWIGDAGIARIIDSYRHAAEENGAWDARHSVEHCEMIQDRTFRGWPPTTSTPRCNRLTFSATMKTASR